MHTNLSWHSGGVTASQAPSVGGGGCKRGGFNPKHACRRKLVGVVLSNGGLLISLLAPCSGSHWWNPLTAAIGVWCLRRRQQQTYKTQVFSKGASPPHPCPRNLGHKLGPPFERCRPPPHRQALPGRAPRSCTMPRARPTGQNN